MTVKAKILKELRKWTPLAEIDEKFRSQSRKYEAFGIFLPEATENLEKMRKKFEKLKANVKATKAELQGLEREKQECSLEVEDLVETREQLREQVACVTAELDQRNVAIEKLQARGFTPGIIDKIMVVESRSGPELLHQIKTVEQHTQIKRKISHLKKSKNALEEKVQNLRANIEELEKKLRSEQNQLDELRLSTATFGEAVNLVCSLLKNGYSPADIESFKHGLKMLGIKGDPSTSLTRLVKGLLKYKTLIALNDKTRALKKELKMLKTAISEANSKLKVAKQIITTFEEVRAAGLKAISETSEQAKTKMKDNAEASEKHMTASANGFDAHIQNTMEKVRAELGEWGELKEKEGRLKETLFPGAVLLGILKEPEYLNQIPTPLMLRLFESLQLWANQNLKDVTVQPSQRISKKDFNLHSFVPYKISVLIDFICEELREIVIQRS